MLAAAILAGGFATRLRPLTERIPKSMVPINGEPLIGHQLRLLKSRGLSRVVLCVGHLSEMIEDYVGDGARFGLQVVYSPDGAAPLGTAGAIRNALPLLNGAFFTIYGDSYLRCDYAAVERCFEESGTSGLMTVFRNQGKWDSSNVEFRGGKLLLYDKHSKTPRMEHIDYGLGVFRREVFEDLPNGPWDLGAVYQDLLAKQDLTGFEVNERFYEGGSFEGIAELSDLLAAPAKYHE